MCKRFGIYGFLFVLSIQIIKFSGIQSDDKGIKMIICRIFSKSIFIWWK